MNLRSRTIRLAHTHPELRQHLLPLLVKTAGNVIYVGVFFDAGEMNKAARWFEAETGLELLPRTPNDPHVTTAFKPAPEDVVGIGETVRVPIVGWAADERAQALVVDYPSRNATPHITLRLDSTTPPVYSNDLLARGYTKARGPILTGTVGYYDKQGVHTSVT